MENSNAMIEEQRNNLGERVSLWPSRRTRQLKPLSVEEANIV
jgi:hypothetical protein